MICLFRSWIGLARRNRGQGVFSAELAVIIEPPKLSHGCSRLNGVGSCWMLSCSIEVGISISISNASQARFYSRAVGSLLFGLATGTILPAERMDEILAYYVQRTSAQHEDNNKRTMIETRFFSHTRRMADTHDSNDLSGIQGFHLRKSDSTVDLAAADVERRLIRQYSANMSPSAEPQMGVKLLSSSVPLVTEGFKALIDDSFTRCFEANVQRAWNWNVYLWLGWVLGIVIRYAVLFPIRALVLAAAHVLFVVGLAVAQLVPSRQTSKTIERWLIQFLCSAYVASWSGVVRVHGVWPKPSKGRVPGVFVANHSSMIDFVILQHHHSYAVVGQKHAGWVGMMQTKVLSSLQCIWFDRSASQNRKAVAEQLATHANDFNRNPLLVFPEGTCVNNEYVVQFKKGVFELGVPICPVAIKYNENFANGYWNSRQMSFARHLFSLMTSWALVCDIWYLEPQFQQPGESGAAFAERVQKLIAKTAGLKAVEWDGYMKYWKPSERFIKARRAAIADQVGAATDDEPVDGQHVSGLRFRHTAQHD